MKLLLDFEPCKECNSLMNELSNMEIMFGEEDVRSEKSAKFLRHLTYSHNEVVQAVLKEVKERKRSPEFDLYK